MARRPVPIKVKSKDLAQIGQLLRSGVQQVRVVLRALALRLLAEGVTAPQVAQTVPLTIAPLDKAAKLAPALLAARASLGCALLAANRAADAVPHLRAALPADRDGSLHFQLSRALAVQGKTAEAAQFAQKSQQRRLAGDDGQSGEITPPQ
jgi:tetratricopeptide (TPR) repeat protein